LALLDLTATKEVPGDCNLLIVAGPVTTIDAEQAERIQRYLDQGGRLLALFSFRQVFMNRPSGLERLLASWGIEVGQDIVLDPPNASQGADGADPKPVYPGTHPIVNSLGSAQVHFFWPRSMHAMKSGRREEAKVDPLLFTGPKSVVLSDFDRGNARSRTAVPPQSLAVAVEKSIAGLERGATRIVGIGDSTFWSNKLIDYDANRDFATSTVNWLVQQNMLLGEIPRQAIRTYRLTMTNRQMSTSRWLLLAGMPGAVLLIGFVVWVRRRK
jgi:ABC-type uncharacterized transport system involved in gliding motility auxiliary subunit